jgi:hypothetical protein
MENDEEESSEHPKFGCGAKGFGPICDQRMQPSQIAVQENCGECANRQAIYSYTETAKFRGDGESRKDYSWDMKAFRTSPLLHPFPQPDNDISDPQKPKCNER